MTNIASNVNVNTPVSTPSQGTTDSTSSNAAIDTSNLSNAAQKAALAVMAALASADNQNTASNSNGSSANAFAPNLTPPSSNASPDSTQLLASIAEALSQNAEHVIQNNAAAFNAAQASAQQQALAQAQQAQNSLTLASEASDVANSYKSPGGSGQAITLTVLPANDPSYADSQTLAQLQTNLSQAYVSYQAAQQNPDLQSSDPALLQQAQAKLSNAQTTYQNALNAVYEFASQETQKANNTLTQLTSNAIPLMGLQKQMNSDLAKIVELISEITDLMSKSAKERLNRDQKLFEELQKASQKALEAAAEKYEADLAKAKQTQDTMGCIGDIIGAIIVVVGAIVAVATAETGVGVAVGIGIAAVGLAMITADVVLRATGQQTLSDRIMQPIMDKIFQPMINALTKAFSELLEKLGVGKDMAEKVGMGLAMATVAIAVIAVIVLVALFGKGAAVKLAEKFGEKFAQMTAKNILQQIVKQLAQQAVKLTAKDSAEAGSQAALKKTIELVGKTTIGAASVAQGAVQIVGGIEVARMIEETSKDKAAMEIDQAILKLLESLLKQAIETYGDANKAIQDLINSMAQTIQGNANTTAFILGNIGSKSA